MDRSLGSRLYALMVLALATAGCDLAEGIFKAGMWAGILMVVVVIGIILFVVAKLKR